MIGAVREWAIPLFVLLLLLLLAAARRAVRATPEEGGGRAATGGRDETGAGSPPPLARLRSILVAGVYADWRRLDVTGRLRVLSRRISRGEGRASALRTADEEDERRLAHLLALPRSRAGGEAQSDYESELSEIVGRLEQRFRDFDERYR